MTKRYYLIDSSSLLVKLLKPLLVKDMYVEHDIVRNETVTHNFSGMEDFLAEQREKGKSGIVKP